MVVAVFFFFFLPLCAFSTMRIIRFCSPVPDLSCGEAKRSSSLLLSHVPPALASQSSRRPMGSSQGRDWTSHSSKVGLGTKHGRGARGAMRGTASNHRPFAANQSVTPRIGCVSIFVFAASTNDMRDQKPTSGLWLAPAARFLLHTLHFFPVPTEAVFAFLAMSPSRRSSSSHSPVLT